MSASDFNLLYKFIILVALVGCNSFILSRFAYADDYLFEGRNPLTDDEIKAKLISNSVTGNSPNEGVSFTVYYPAYGELKGAAGPWDIFTDEGTWSVKNGVYCATWDSWSDNEQLCFRVYAIDDSIAWVNLNGTLYSKDTFVIGNPAKF